MFSCFFRALQVLILTPKKVFAEDVQASQVILPGNSGHVGILPNHANLVSCIEVGVLSVQTQDEWQFFAVNTGFASVQRDRGLVLVEFAKGPDDIVCEEAEQNLESALSAFGQEGADLKTSLEAKLALKRARTRLAVRKVFKNAGFKTQWFLKFRLAISSKPVFYLTLQHGEKERVGLCGLL